MEASNLYDPNSHIRTEQVYNYPNGSYTEFFSSDNNLKVRGPGRDILFFNEANLTDFDTFTQLMLRTRKCIFIDFNPADEFHWIYDNILTRPDCYFIKSTYLDNPFLPHEQVKEIENLKNVDENFWRIYGEGERGHSEGVIYTHWVPFNNNISGSVAFGLDFGYNNPTALMRVYWCDNDIYIEPVIYESYLTTTNLIDKLGNLGIEKSVTIVADYARPEIIAEMNNAGYDVQNANKVVKKGIDNMKSFGVVCEDDVRLKKEYENYKWKKVGDQIMDEPVKLYDDAMDAIRYATTYIRQEYYTDDSYYSF